MAHLLVIAQGATDLFVPHVTCFRMSRPGDKRMHEDNIYRHYRPVSYSRTEPLPICPYVALLILEPCWQDFANLARLYPDKLGD